METEKKKKMTKEEEIKMLKKTLSDARAGLIAFMSPYGNAEEADIIKEIDELL